MNNKLVFLFGAAIGGAIGFAVSTKYYKKKYSEQADKEISEMKLYYQKKCSEINFRKPDISQIKESKAADEHYVANERDLQTANDIIGSEHYEKHQEMEEDDMAETRPFLITADIFHQTDGYEKCVLVYYANNILADENDEIVDINDTVTYDQINDLPDYDGAVIYVRNGQIGIDYEINRDERTYEEATGIFLDD